MIKKILEDAAILDKEEQKEFVPVLNDAFKSWFADSKVVDDNGQPLVCYHGSTVDIEEFDLRFSGSTTGNNREEVFYFTSDKDTAITYSQQATVRENEWRFYDEETGFEDWEDYKQHLEDEVFENPHINPCYLYIKNPYIIDADYSDFNYKMNYTIISIIKHNTNIDSDMWDDDIAEQMYQEYSEYDEENDEWIDTDPGYDGVIIKNVRDNIDERNGDYIDEYIVWDPYQIKSVYNKGIWSNSSANVMESVNERFEKLEDDIFATNSGYEVINYCKNKPKAYRIVYDNNTGYYYIGDAYNYIHQDLIEAAYNSGFYPDGYRNANDYMLDNLEDGNVCLFAFYPDENKKQDIEKSSDGYTRKYVYDYGTYYSHELSELEAFPIYKLLGEPVKKEDVFIDVFESLNEKLEKHI